LCDFDGTIAPIVRDPETSRPVPGALAALHELARNMAVVAVVSGRSASFLAERLELARFRSPLRAIGLHGLEEWAPEGTLRLRPGVAAWRPTIEAALAELLTALPYGVRVEDKGYGLTVHWRSVSASSSDLDALAARATDKVREIGVNYGLSPRLGKASVELAVPLGIDKGVVVNELCGALHGAAYLGDDLGDLLAFRALDQLRSVPGLACVKITVTSTEVPAELLEEADLVLSDPIAAGRFLEVLAGRLRRS